jgi:hypothetical protein
MTNDLQTKLRFGDAHCALLLGVPDGYLGTLGTLPPDTLLDTIMQGEYDFVQAFVTKRSDLERELPTIIAAAISTALVWICYPKAGHGISTDLNRDIVRDMVEVSTTWRCVTQVAIDTTWSALRLRPRVLVGH